MRALTVEDRDLKYSFDKNSETEAAIYDSSLEKLHIKNHEVDANNVEIEGQLLLAQFFGFCKTFENVPKK